MGFLSKNAPTLYMLLATVSLGLFAATGSVNFANGIWACLILSGLADLRLTIRGE